MVRYCEKNSVTDHYWDEALNCGDSPCFCCIEQLLYYGHFAGLGVLDIKAKNVLIIIVMMCQYIVYLWLRLIDHIPKYE